VKRYFRILGPQPERDVDEELTSHVEMHVAYLVARGRSPGDARTEALRRFGDIERVRHECERLEQQKARTMTRARIFDEFVQDVHWAFRSLGRKPAFLIVTVLALGLGIGANAAIFSVVNAYLFRPLPVRDAARLAVVAQVSRGSDVPGSVSYLNYESVRQLLPDVIDDAVLFQISAVSARLPGAGEAERLYINLVSGNYFQMLGVAPAAGAMFSADAAGRREPLVVLDYRYWQRRFHGDKAIVGQAIRLNGIPYTVAGIAERRFTGTEEMVVADAFVPITTAGLLVPGQERLLAERTWSSSRVLAHLRPGVGIAQARLALAGLAKRLKAQYPELDTGFGLVTAMETDARPDIAVSHVMPWLAAVFMALVGLVLLIACVNVANLMLARAASRQAELAVRRALGASNARLIRQLITESVVLAMLGLVVGLVLARWVTAWLSNIRLATDFPIRFDVAPDWRVVAFAGGVALLAGIVTGLAPALQSARGSLSDVLRDGARASAGRSRHRIRGALVVAQVAVSLVLLICAGLFTQSVRTAANADLGFQPSHLLLMTVDLTLQRYDSAQRDRFYATLLERARALPGVRAAGIARDLPMGGNNSSYTIFFDTDVPTVEDRRLDIYSNTVSPDYFATMALPLVAGREFTRFDADSSPHVAVINVEMARRFWPGQDPLRQGFRTTRDGPLIQVVGVVRPTKYMFLNEAPGPYVYFPVAQRPITNVTLHLRTTGDPTAVIASARAMFRTIDPDLLVFDVKTMEQHLNDGIAFLFVRLGAVLATAVGLLGLIQTIVGLYGVIAYGVSQRTREIGIRMALGADGGSVVRSVMAQGLVLTAIGLVIGLVLAFVVTRLMQGLLFGVSPTDAMTFTAATLLLLGLSALSAYLPARRASRLEPLSALRTD